MRRVLALLPAILLLAWPSPGRPCTLWAAAGEKALGGGTIIVKNRDWRPEFPNGLKFVTPQGGHRYLALIEEGHEASGVKAGLNEAGLVVVSATSPFPRRERLAFPRVKGRNAKLLTRCATVREALAQSDLFLGPDFLMLADPKEVAVVEVAPEGRFRVRSTANGALWHTNHYLDPDLVGFNPPAKEGHDVTSSQARARLIEAALAARPAFSAEDFIKLSFSKEGGPDHALWREGKTPAATRTLATWLVHQEPGKPARLFLRLLNLVEGTVTERTITHQEIFVK